MKWLKELLFPRKCLLCRRILRKEEADLCRSCCAEAPIYPFGAANPETGRKNTRQFLDSFTAVWYYESNVRSSILRFKFRNGIGLAPGFGRMLADKLRSSGPEEYDILTWVPISSRRKQERGYDQCELLAEETGKALGCPHSAVLKKIRHNPPQSGLTSPEERKANVLGAYAMRPGVDIAGKRILILDDIYTTGATMNECAKVLRIAGAGEVHSAVIASVRHRKK